MNANTLAILADAADGSAGRMERKRSTSGHHYANAQTLRIAAEDARREVQASNGMGSYAGYLWSVCVEHDRKLSTRVDELVAKHAPERYAEHGDDANALANSHLADALRDWIELARALRSRRED